MSLQLDRIFSDGMVLQREKRVAVWGAADPGCDVEVRVQGGAGRATAGTDGAWRCVLGPLHASEGEELVVRSGDECLTLADVAVGEVFVAGGQSNMEFWMRYDRDVESVRPTCANPRIRFYDVPKCSYPGQLDDFDFSQVGVWRKATPEDLDRFSAVGYYFSCALEEELDVPVGIVGCNYGGTISSAWMRADHAAEVDPEQVAAFEAKLAGHTYEELLAAGKLNPGKNDKGYAIWPAWNEFFLPRTPTMEEVGAFMKAEAAKATGPADVGGLEVAGAEGDESASSSAEIDPALLTPTKEAPGSLFTFMVLPIAGFAARGVLWYQGESDDEFDGAQWRYTDAMRTIMADWREAWDDASLPFLMVQLPGFGDWMGMGPNDYVTIRACQQQVADADPHAWLCSIGDVGDEHDIHPKVKRSVGERLALLALRHLYGRDVLADAPRAIGATREGDRIRVAFESAGESLMVEGESVNALEVLAGGKPIAFDAHAEGDCLVIDPDGQPAGEVRVRFARTNWYCVNLYNSAHIPALPFEVVG